MDYPDILTGTIREIAEVARCLWEKGWAERNAGNISVNLTGRVDPEGPELTSPVTPLDCGTFPGLSGQVFLVSGMGTRMREVAVKPEAGLCLIKISEGGAAYRQIPLLVEESRLLPTSELPTHLAVHQELWRKGAAEKALLHTHATRLIALTHIREYCAEERLNRLLWAMHPETRLFLPEGAGFVPFTEPGTEAIAKATVKAFEKHRAVVWEKHGCLAAGKTVNEAFDLLDLLDKSASIYFTCRSAGFEPEGLTDEGELEEG